MECSDFEEQIVDYLEQGMALAERLAFSHHLLSCRDCRTLTDDIRENIDLCRRSSDTFGRTSRDTGTTSTALRFLPPPERDINIDQSTIGEMISCRSLDLLIGDYFESVPAIPQASVPSPDPAWGQLLSAHLDQCAACATLFEGLRQASEAAPVDSFSNDHKQAQLEARIIAATAGIRL